MTSITFKPASVTSISYIITLLLSCFLLQFFDIRSVEARPLSRQSAQEMVLNGLSGQEIRLLLTEFGQPALEQSDNSGDPLLIATSNGMDWRILFYDCTGGTIRYCTSISYNARIQSGKKITLAQVNTWNRANRWAKLSQHEDGGIILEMDLAVNGVSPQIFKQSWRVWRAALQDVKNRFG